MLGMRDNCVALKYSHSINTYASCHCPSLILRSYKVSHFFRPLLTQPNSASHPHNSRAGHGLSSECCGKSSSLSSTDTIGFSLEAMPAHGRPTHKQKGVNGRRVLEVLNELTKWTVSAAAFVVLLWRRDLPVVWCLLGSIANVVVCKVLKRLINEQRPRAARKEDPGMPSSHAQSLGYLSVCAAIGLLATWGGEGGQGRLAAGGVMALGVFLTWLRVVSGYHTTAQVLVGFTLGSCTALAWQRWGFSHVLPLAAHQAWLAQAMHVMTALALVAFAVKTLSGVAKDAKRLKALFK